MKKNLVAGFLLLFILFSCTQYVFVPFPIGGNSGNDESTEENGDIWDGSTKDTTWYNRTSTSFSLSTAAELAGLASLVNSGTDFERKTVTLLNDIDLGGFEWTPIGTESTSFKGTIRGEGDGIEIINLKISSEVKSSSSDGQNVAGFIGFLEGGGIENITFSDASISVGEDVATAVVAGFMNGGTINKVEVNNADIQGEYKSDMGAIVGKLYDSGSVTNCKVIGTSIILDAKNNEWMSCNIGGIVGSFSHVGVQTEKIISDNVVDLSADPNAIFNIENYAQDDALPVGGIIGQIGGGTEGKVSGNTLKIANINQIAEGKGCIVTGYSQEFYGYSKNTGMCGTKTWTSTLNHESGELSNLQ